MIRNLTITACAVLFTATTCYAKIPVGASYGGGTVFCVSDTLEDIINCSTDAGASGYFGLIMANEDQANYDSNPRHGISWAEDMSPTNAQSDNDGAANTRTIIAALPDDDASNNAAWLCHEYRDPEGHTDWYLPAKNELNQMYSYAKANNLIGKDCTGSQADGMQCLIGNVYWSSNEDAGRSYFVWHQCFSNGFQDFNDKPNDYFGVRAVRVFNSLTLQHFNYLLTEGKTQRGNRAKQRSEKSQHGTDIMQLRLLFSQLLTGFGGAMK